MGPHCGSVYVPSPTKSTEQLSAVAIAQRRDSFLNRGIALVALSYHAPMTLANSLRSWKRSGLLDLVSERVIVLNDPLPQESALAAEFGFRVVEPKSVKNSKASVYALLSLKIGVLIVVNF